MQFIKFINEFAIYQELQSTQHSCNASLISHKQVQATTAFPFHERAGLKQPSPVGSDCKISPSAIMKSSPSLTTD